MLKMLFTYAKKERRGAKITNIGYSHIKGKEEKRQVATFHLCIHYASYCIAFGVTYHCFQKHHHFQAHKISVNVWQLDFSNEIIFKISLCYLLSIFEP